MISSREMVWVVNDNSTVVGFDDRIFETIYRRLFFKLDSLFISL